MTSAPPFFVVGMARSGTTLLRAMLERHPDIAVPPESHFIPRIWARRHRYGSADELQDIERFLQDLNADPLFRNWGLPADAVRSRLASTRPSTVAAGIAELYRAYAAKEGKTRWGDKTPDYVGSLQLLDGLFPAALFVHMVRDGRDVALSILDRSELHARAATPAFFWARAIRQARAASDVLGPQRYLEVRYEDLLDDPESELSRLCAFLGAPFSAMMLEHDTRLLERLPERYKGMHERLALPPTKGLRDWRRDMAPAEVAEFEAVAGPQLDATGYERHDARPPVVARMRAWGRVGWFTIRTLRRRRRLREQTGPRQPVAGEVT